MPPGAGSGDPIEAAPNKEAVGPGLARQRANMGEPKLAKSKTGGWYPVRPNLLTGSVDLRFTQLMADSESLIFTPPIASMVGPNQA